MSVVLREPVEDGDRLWVAVSLLTSMREPEAYSAKYRFHTNNGAWSITTRRGECPPDVLRAAVASRIEQALRQIDRLEAEVARLTDWHKRDADEARP